MQVEPRPKAPAKKRKHSSKTPLAVCDAMFSRLVRSRGACEACGQSWDLQCAHGFSRRYRAVRWDERQCFCLCRGCHLKYTMRPLEWDEWMRARMGAELYEQIRVLALTGPNPRLAEVAERLRAVCRERGIEAA